jgi:hypothetical protein
VSWRGWWPALAAWALLGLALLAAAGMLAVFVVLAAVAWLVLLGVRSVLGPQFAPPYHATRPAVPATPERYRLADDLATPIERVITAAELDAAAVITGEQRRLGAPRRW